MPTEIETRILTSQAKLTEEGYLDLEPTGHAVSEHGLNGLQALLASFAGQLIMNGGPQEQRDGTELLLAMKVTEKYRHRWAIDGETQRV